VALTAVVYFEADRTTKRVPDEHEAGDPEPHEHCATPVHPASG
jgi:hypothetical protein